MRRTWFRLAGVAGFALALGATGCKSSSNAGTAAPIVDGSTSNSVDPASANLAQPGADAVSYSSSGSTSQQPQPARVLSSSSAAPQQASGESYPQQAQYPPDQYANQTGAVYDQAYDQDQAAVDAGEQALYAEQAPPPLPEYQQPELSDPGDIWTPGYWSYAQSGYYWVPGAWVAPPTPGYLWTPGYWGSTGGRYRFHYGFWGPHIGFYGGVNYGYGYTGAGYYGGYWNHDHFFYNTQVNRVNVNVVHDTYVHNVTIVNNSRVSFNGPQGIQARPNAAQVAVYHERVIPQMHAQQAVAVAAASNRNNFYAENHGRPAVAVSTARVVDHAPPAAIRPAAAVRAPELQARPGVAPAMQPGRPGAVQPGERPGTSQPNVARPGVPPAAQPRVEPAQQQNAQRQQQVQQQNAQRQQVQQQNVQRQQTEQARPAQPAVRPQPVQPAVRPQPVQPAARPQPAPQAQPAPRPAPQAQSAPRPAPQAQPAARPAPEARPAPAAPPRPAPAAAPAPRPQPAPQQHAAPPAPHAAPPAREEKPHR